MLLTSKHWPWRIFSHIQGPTILRILGPTELENQPLIIMLGLLPIRKSPTRSKDLDQVLQRGPTSNKALAIDFTSHHGARVCLTGPLPHLSIFKFKSKETPKGGRCLKTCQSPWSRGSPDTTRRAIPIGPTARRFLSKKQMFQSFGWALLELTLLARHHHADTPNPEKAKARSSSWSSITISVKRRTKNEPRLLCLMVGDDP